jgi:hypothetical protein
MPHDAPIGLDSTEIVIADASPGCAAVAVVEDEGSDGGFRVVLAPEMARLPMRLRLDVMGAMAVALASVVVDLRLLDATGRL